MKAITDIQQETVDFLCKNPDCLSTDGRRKFFYQAKLDGLLTNINNDLAPKEVFINIIQYLQMQNSFEIINLLQLIDIGKNSTLEETRKKLIKDWKIISSHPIRYLFSTYIEKRLKNKRYIKLDEVYIDLYGEEEIKHKIQNEINTIGVEVTDFWDSFEKYENQENAKEKPIIDTIVNISQYKEQFVIIGAPDCGKTTTLEKILFNNLLQIKNGNKNSKLPILIIANEFNTTGDFEQLITKEFPAWNNQNIDKSKFLLLIDGINEIIPSKQILAINQLKNILSDDNYEHTSIIISSRKYGFSDNYKLPVFEIKQLNDTQVRSYIAAYKPQEEEIIWNQIQENQYLHELAFNPLTLFMITWVNWHNNIIPNNRGLLFKSFINQIFKRERKVGNIVELSTKIELLSEIAFSMRIGKFSLSFKQTHNIFNSKIHNYDTSYKLIDNLCNNYILKTSSGNNIDMVSPDERISFVHESYLEYFSAVALQNIFLENGELPIDYTDTEWFETLKITSDLFSNKNDLIKFIDYLFVGGCKHHKRKKIGAGVIQKNKISISKCKWEINKEDFNERLDIACKVVYNIRLRFPEVYNIFENYLNNQLFFWSNYYYSTINKDNLIGEEIIPFENMLAACAGISSTKILKKILYSDKWTFIWLDYYIDQKWETHLKENFINRANAFFNNLSDFELVYNLLIKKPVAKSFHNPIKLFEPLKKILTDKIPLKLSKDLYKKTYNLNLLEKIGREDIDFYINNYNIEKHDLKPFINYLLSFSHNRQAQEKLLSFLSHPKITNNQKNKILIEFISKYFAVPAILHYLEKYYQTITNKKLLEVTHRYLNHIPINIIPKTLKHYEFSYETTKGDQIKLTDNNIFFNNPKIIAEFEGGNTGYLKREIKYLISELIFKHLGDETEEIPKYGIILDSDLSILTRYNNWEKTKKNNYRFFIEDSIKYEKKFTEKIRDNYLFILYNDVFLRFKCLESVRKEDISKSEFRVISSEKKIKTSGKIKLLPPWRHNTKQFDIVNQKLKKVIFDQQPLPKQFAIIIKLIYSKNQVHIYCPSECQYRIINIYPGDFILFNEEQIVILQDNYIYPADNHLSKNDLGYIRSFVCTVKEDYYFIYNSKGKDFFVHKSNGPIVQEKDIVTFYPSINLSYRNFNKPLARKIIKEKVGEIDKQSFIENLTHLDNDDIEKKIKNHIAVEPQNIHLLNKISSHYIRLKKYELAIKHIKKAIKINKKDNYTLFLFTQYYHGIKDWDNAIKLYKHLYIKYNDDAAFISNYIDCLIQSQNNSKALQIGMEYLNFTGYTEHTVPVLKKVFNLFIKRNDIERIEKLLQELPIEISDKLYTVKLDLANIYENKNNIFASEYYFEKGLKNNPNPFHYINYIVFLYKYGKFNKIDYYYNKALRLIENEESKFNFKLKYTNKISQIIYVKIYGNVNDEEKAIAIIKPKLKEAKELLKNNQIILGIKLLKGIIHKQSIFEEDAKKILYQFINEPLHNNEEILSNLRYYELALKKDNNFWTKIEYAYALYYCNNYSKSIIICDCILQDKINNSEIYNLRANNMKEIGDFQNAKLNYEIAINYSNSPYEQAKYYNNLALLMIDLQLKYSASEYLRKGRKLASDYYWFDVTEKKIDKLLKDETRRKTNLNRFAD